MAASGRGPGMLVMCSPVAKPTINNRTPPAIICDELAIKPFGLGRCWLKMEPKAQPIGAINNTIAPRGLACSPFPKFKSTKPENPNPNPNHSMRVGQRPKSPEKTAAQRGIAPNASAARPDETHCSAKTTPPLPTTSNSPPTTIAANHCFPVGNACLRSRKKMKRRMPAVSCLTPARIKGGNPCKAMRIARYVPPQRKYSESKDRMMNNRLRMLEELDSTARAVFTTLCLCSTCSSLVSVESISLMKYPV